MPALVVDRPVWRSFTRQHFARAAGWVRSGGSAAIVDSPKRVHMLLPTDATGKATELGYWSVLALEQQRYRKIKDGPARGLALARVGSHAIDAVMDWVERDAGHPGPTRRLRLDCLKCAACCHDASVYIDDDDMDRFRRGGRSDLCGSKFIRRDKEGRIVLRVLKTGKCHHLRGDNKCDIYAIRPYNCSVFPVGSEACLSARESTLGIRDGLGVADGYRRPA